MFVIDVWLTAAAPRIRVDGRATFGHILAYATLMLWLIWAYSNPWARSAHGSGFAVLGINLELALAPTDGR